MSGRIIWLVSFPKSGNTWTRVLLTNYQRNAEQPADINDLESTPVAGSRHIFDEATGLESSEMTTAEIERLRPAVYERISAQAKETEFMKVHDAWTCVPDGAPLFPAAATQGVIFLLRNPLDVAVSFSHHSGAEIDRIITGTNDDDVRVLLSGWGGDELASFNGRGILPSTVARGQWVALHNALVARAQVLGRGAGRV